MIDSSFRDSLLKQNGDTPMDAQLKVLDDIVNADRRYVRRLTIWTIVVWATWITMIAISLGVPMVLAATAPRTASPPQEPVTATTPVPSNSGSSMGVVATTLVFAVLAVFYSLPIAGVILLVMMIAARRTATMSQIQASLLSINAQLKLMQNSKTPSTSP